MDCPYTFLYVRLVPLLLTQTLFIVSHILVYASYQTHNLKKLKLVKKESDYGWISFCLSQKVIWFLSCDSFFSYMPFQYFFINITSLVFSKLKSFQLLVPCYIPVIPCWAYKYRAFLWGYNDLNLFSFFFLMLETLI